MSYNSWFVALWIFIHFLSLQFLNNWNLLFIFNRETYTPEVEKEVKDAEPSADEEETEKSTNGDAVENGDSNDADEQDEENEKKEEKDSTVSVSR